MTQLPGSVKNLNSHSVFESGGLGGLVYSALDFQVGYHSNPARVETIFRPLVRVDHTRHALG